MDDLRPLASQLATLGRVLVALPAVLEQTGSVDRDLSAKQAELAKVDTALTDTKVLLAKARSDLADAKAAAQRESALVIDGAHQHAEQLRLDAENFCADLKAKCQTVISRVEADAKLLATANAKVVSEIESAKRYYAELEAKLIDAQQTIAKAEAIKKAMG